MASRDPAYTTLRIGEPKPGETVFVPAAAGAVGSVVCQIAKIKGCSASSARRRRRQGALLTEVAGIDAAINYRRPATSSPPSAARAPTAIDIYYENVGGAHLESRSI